MKAVKGNVQLTLGNEAEAEGLRGDGFDIYLDDGELLQHAKGKKISMEEHERLLLEAIEGVEIPDEKGVIAENKELKKALVTAQKSIAELSGAERKISLNF